MQNILPTIQYRLIFKILGALTAITGLWMMIPALYALIDQAHGFFALFSASVISLAVGLFTRYALGGVKHARGPEYIGKREGFIIVTFSWFTISFFGALPFMFSSSIPNFVDAFFETISGFTTTGASVLSDIEALPKSILLWRSMTQWIGGIGIIVFCLAILPMMGMGGNNLFAAEASGPTKDKIHPRIAETAKRLFSIYLGLTLLEVLFLCLGEMTLYEAVNHAMTTMATGGFSVRNDSMVGYSAYSQYVVTIFMFLAGINFSLYYFAAIRRFQKIRENSELKAYALFSLCAALFITAVLFVNHVYTDPEEAFRHSAFMATSIITTTGFVSAEYSLWVPSTQLVLIMLMFSGACAGSTTGGIKIVRHVLLVKNMRQEFKRLIHSRAVLPVRYNGKTIPNEVIKNVLAFFFVYLMIFALGTLIMSMLGYSAETAISMSATALSNVGPGAGDICALCNFADVPSIGKWVLSLWMVIGRLELFTVLILFTPIFWRK